MSEDLSNFSMFDLFRVEVENQAQVLTAGLLALERNPVAADQLEATMRAAHSLKGAARIVGLDAGVSVAHAMEDCLVAAQQGRLTLDQARIDLLLRGVDLLTRISQTPEIEAAKWTVEKKAEIDGFIDALADGPDEAGTSLEPPRDEANADAADVSAPVATADGGETSDRVLRVTAANLNHLLGLASESLVESRWLKPFAESLLRLKRMHYDLGRSLDGLREANAGHAGDAAGGWPARPAARPAGTARARSSARRRSRRRRSRPRRGAAARPAAPSRRRPPSARASGHGAAAEAPRAAARGDARAGGRRSDARGRRR